MILFWWLRRRIKRIAAHFMLVIEFCDDCGTRVEQVWHADDELWARFGSGRMGRDGSWCAEAGCLCIPCFSRRADKHVVLMWRPEVEFERVSMQGGSSKEEHGPYKPDGAGSSPARPTSAAPD